MTPRHTRCARVISPQAHKTQAEYALTSPLQPSFYCLQHLYAHRDLMMIITLEDAWNISSAFLTIITPSSLPVCRLPERQSPDWLIGWRTP